MITIDYKSRVPIYDQITGGIIRLKTLGVLKEDDDDDNDGYVNTKYGRIRKSR